MDISYIDHINNKFYFDKECLYGYRYKYPFIPLFCGPYEENKSYRLLDCVVYENSIFCSKLDDNNVPPANIDCFSGEIVSYNTNNWMNVIEKEKLYAFIREQISKQSLISNSVYIDSDKRYTVTNYQNIKKGQTVYINIECENDAFVNPIIKYENINGVYNLTSVDKNIHEMYIDVPDDASSLILEADSVHDRNVIFCTNIADYDINTLISSDIDTDFERILYISNIINKGDSIIVKYKEINDPFKGKNICIKICNDIGFKYLINRNTETNIKLLDDVSNVKILVSQTENEISGFNDGEAFFTIFVKRQ